MHPPSATDKKKKKGWWSLPSQAVGLWFVRRQLSALIKTYRGSPEDGVDDCLRHLRRFPELAQERFEREIDNFLSGDIFPLSFLLEMGADIEVVKEAYRMHPDAVKEKAFRNGKFRGAPCPYLKKDLPLHRACQGGRVSPEVIQYLVSVHPKAACCPDSQEHYALHSLLRNPHRSATLEEVETLLDIHPVALAKDCGAGTPIVVALKGSRATKNVLELLVRRFSERQFSLPSTTNIIERCGRRYIQRYDNYHTITLADAQTLSILLPRIKSFVCLPKHWHVDGFLHLMMNLRQAQSLISLSLHMPPSLLRSDNDEEVCHTIQNLLEQTKALQTLHMDFGFFHHSEEAARPIKTCIGGLLDGLRVNKTLRECYLSGDILSREDVLWDKRAVREVILAPLAGILRESNLTLEKMSLTPPFLKAPDELLQVQYWMSLNQCGRAQARNPDLTVHGFSQLLLNAKKLKGKGDCVRILFGLLQECPGLWSQNLLGCPPTTQRLG